MQKVETAISKAIVGTEFEHKTFIVGGYVRDCIMGVESNDIDIVVEMEHGGRKLAEHLHEQGVASHPVIFDNFGTALVEIKGYKVEMVKTRKESYRDRSRKPLVETGTLEDDVYRRDFTINSLLMDIVSGEIRDITGKGKSDIENKIIRSTSNPEIIFGEDPLRMLRAVRFAITLGFEIEAETEKGIIQNCDSLQYISWERKREELVKMFISKTPETAIRMLMKYDLMKDIIPEVCQIVGMVSDKQHDRDVFEHSLAVMSNVGPNLKVRLAALLHDIGRIDYDKGIHLYRKESHSAKVAAEILKRLKFPKDEINEISTLIKNSSRLKHAGSQAEEISDKAIRKLIHSVGDSLELLLLLIHGNNVSHTNGYNMPEQVPNLRKRINNIREEMYGKTMPVSGHDIMFHFRLTSGSRVGELMHEAEDIWHEHPYWTKEEILEELEKQLQEQD